MSLRRKWSVASGQIMSPKSVQLSERTANPPQNDELRNPPEIMPKDYAIT